MLSGDGFTLRRPGGQENFYPVGKDLAAVSQELRAEYPHPIIAAKVDNMLAGLDARPGAGSKVELVHLGTEAGIRIYGRSLSCVLIRAARELYPGCTVRVEHSLSKGVFCEIHCEREFGAAEVSAVEERMRQIVAAAEPIERETLPWAEAMAIYQARGQAEMVGLLRHRTGQPVDFYRCGWMREHFYEILAPDTGMLTTFYLQPFPPGLILRLPEKENPQVVSTYVPQHQLSGIFLEAERWGKIQEVGDVGSLNDLITAGQGAEMIHVGEALHEKKIAQMADLVSAERERLRVITIAGPSSSGKTTFAQRLSVQMRVNGLRPVAISADDYFLDREHTPRDENGDYDYEAIEAIDLELFNSDLTRLIHGEEVAIPTFNFLQGAREYTGRKLRIRPDQIVIIEGIHGLNERLTAAVPRENKYKIYISALTQINIDGYNRIPTTDARILRRIVRDSQFRGHNAQQTINRWASVRRGEDRYIFPFQEEADTMFNSALIYELAVLKKYAEPLLQAVSQAVPEYAEANRFLHLLSYFVSLEDTEVSPNSILREFIGGGCFRP